MQKWASEGFFERTDPVWHLGLKTEIISLYKEAIDIAAKQGPCYQQLLGGIVSILLGLARYHNQNAYFGDDSEKMERAKLIIAEQFRTMDFRIHSNLDAVSHATCSMAVDVDAKAIVVNSISGRTARMVSRFRCPVCIIGTTINERAWRKLNLSWGVTPVLTENYSSMDVMFWQDLKLAQQMFELEKGDNVVLTGGQMNGEPGNTNTIKVETIR